MDQWHLIDCRDPVDAPELFPRLVLHSEAQLRDELDRLQQREPAMVGLEGPIAQGLSLGIGGPYAGVRWGEYPVSDRSGTALADQAYCQHRIDFTSEGDTLAFWPAELMPVDQVIEIVVYFFNNHRLPDWVGWNEWDPVGKQWTLKPAVRPPAARGSGGVVQKA